MSATVAVVVVGFETRDEVLACLGSIRDHAVVPTEVVVVDNASSDGTVAAVRRAFPQARLVANPDNRGFSVACNQGLAATRAPLVLFLNSDALLTPDALPRLVRLLEARPNVGVVGPHTTGADGSPQLSFGPPLGPLAEWRQRRLVRGLARRDPTALAAVEAACAREHSPGWVSGACLLARREALRAVEGFDEGFFLYEEDVDLCVRVRAAGWDVVYTPEARVIHRLGSSMKRTPGRARLEYHRSHLRYYRKHCGPVQTLWLRGWMAARALRGLLHDGSNASDRELLRLALGR